MADDHKGYAARFENAGKVLRDVTSLHKCAECDELGLYRRVWRKGNRKGVTLYAIAGSCPNGHRIQRYGYGEEPTEQATSIMIPGVA
jgi:hypothetical protein